jgi:two-component system response regulator FixJ
MAVLRQVKAANRFRVPRTRMVIAEHATKPLPVAPVVVIVDDDAAVTASLRFALETEGLSVKDYQSAASLLAEADPRDTGCLVIDYLLPGTNGLELLRALRKMGVLAPAIIITTNPGSVLRRRVEAEGAEIVEKPLLGNALVEAIRASLSRWVQ